MCWRPERGTRREREGSPHQASTLDVEAALGSNPSKSVLLRCPLCTIRNGSPGRGKVGSWKGCKGCGGSSLAGPTPRRPGRATWRRLGSRHLCFKSYNIRFLHHGASPGASGQAGGISGVRRFPSGPHPTNLSPCPLASAEGSQVLGAGGWGWVPAGPLLSCSRGDPSWPTSNPALQSPCTSSE